MCRYKWLCCGRLFVSLCNAVHLHSFNVILQRVFVASDQIRRVSSEHERIERQSVRYFVSSVPHLFVLPCVDLGTTTGLGRPGNMRSSIIAVQR